MDISPLALLYKKSADEYTRGFLKVDTRLATGIKRYEHIRNIIGFQEPHLWRKHAIERIIRRYLQTGDQLDAERFLEEMVLAGYIKEDEITRENFESLKQIVQKYITGYQSIIAEGDVNRRHVKSWFMGLLSLEIEDLFGLLAREKILAREFAEEMRKRLDFPAFYASEEQEKLFVLIAICQGMLKEEDMFIAYLLIEDHHPEWFRKDDVMELAPAVWKIRSQIHLYRESEFYKNVVRVGKPHFAEFLVLDHLVSNYAVDGNKIHTKMKYALESLYAEIKKQLYRRILNSFIFLVTTKAILVFSIETSYDIWRQGEINWMQLLLNFVIPIFLFLLFPFTARITDDTNTVETAKVVERTLGEKNTVLETRISTPVERSVDLSILFTVLMIAAYVVVYGGIAYLLYRAHFNLVGGFFFLLLITMGVFLGVRLRYIAERYRITPVISPVSVDLLYYIITPMISVGHWLVDRFAGRNSIFLIMIDRLIDPPYKGLVFLLRNFSDFIREKRELIA